MRVPRYQCFSHQMNNRHPWQLKKSKSWGPFWSYQLNSTGNLAHLAHFLGKWAGLAVLFNCVANAYAVWPLYDVKCLCSRRWDWGREALPTSISIFDSYDMKTLWSEFGHDIFTGFKMPTLVGMPVFQPF